MMRLLPSACEGIFTSGSMPRGLLKNITSLFSFFAVATFTLLHGVADGMSYNEKNYGYIYWEKGTPSKVQASADNPNVIIQTGYYHFRMECDSMDIDGYGPLAGTDYVTALKQDVASFTNVGQNFHIWVNGQEYRAKSAIIATGNSLNVRLIEHGQYVQRYDLDKVVFERVSDGAPLGAYGRIEVTAWPDRITFLLDMRDYDGNPVISGLERCRIWINGKAGNAFDDHVELTVQPQTNTQLGSLNVNSYITLAQNVDTSTNLTKTFDPVRHAFVLNTDRTSSPSFPSQIDEIDEFLIEVSNPTSSTANIPIIFENKGFKVTGISMVLLEDSSESPTGIPVQISKNWHKKSGSRTIHDGSWLRGNTMVTLSGNETKRFRLKVIYGEWAGMPIASHAGLSLIGYNYNWKWDESALGSWGENMTFSPTQHPGDSFICDVRPAFTVSMNGSTHNWTENVGGLDFLRYENSSGETMRLVRQKTCFRWTGPNMTEVLYTGVTEDEKIRCTYKSRLGRTYDYQRRFLDFEYEFLEAVNNPDRLVFFQIAAEKYQAGGPDFTSYQIGENNQMQYNVNAPTSGSGYSGVKYPILNKWLNFADYYTDLNGGNPAYTRRGIIFRELKRDGSDWTWARMHEYRFSRWGDQRLAFDLGGTSVQNSFPAGTNIEGTVEFVMPPRALSDYWGLDDEFVGRLSNYTNQWSALQDEAYRNDLSITMYSGTFISSYPVEVKYSNGAVAADFSINSGGIGAVPVIVRDVPLGKALRIQRYRNGAWEWLNDVNIGANSYYQGYYNGKTGKMDYAFNIARHPNDTNLSQSWRLRALTVNQ